MKLTADARRALDALPPKRRAFVLAYCGEAAGNATEAARIAGYKVPNPEGSRLLAFASVAEAVAIVGAPAESKAIASVEEMQEMLTRVARGEEDDESANPMGNRLKAIDLLGKMQGAFIERREVKDVTPPASVDEAAERVAKLHRKLRRVS